MKKYFPFIFFFFCWLIVSFVSCYDMYLTIHLFESLHMHEENPISKEILMAKEWQTVSVFAAYKMFGTLLVSFITICIFFIRRRAGLAIIIGLAIAQGYLLYYLQADHSGVTGSEANIFEPIKLEWHTHRE